jgi:hypothetical protein
MWAGEKLAELLADAVGGKGIYDMVASIPGIGSLVAVDETKPPETTGAEGQLENITESAAAGQSTATEVEGTLSAPSTPNTSVGRMVGEYSAQKEALGDAQMASSGAGRGGVVNNAKVETRVNNTVNNFNDDIRIRNNEPTLKTMQAAAHSF